MTDSTAAAGDAGRESDEWTRAASKPAARAGRSVTRRGVLAATAGAVGGVAGLSGAASAQARFSTTVAIRAAEAFEGNYADQFLVVTSARTTPGSAPGLEDCGETDWSPADSKSYEGLLVDRLAEDPKGVERELFVAAEDREIGAGSTFVVSYASECGDFVALDVDQVGPLVGPDDDGVGTTGGGDGSTPGFTATGVLAGVAGLLGVGALRARGGDGE